MKKNNIRRFRAINQSKSIEITPYRHLTWSLLIKSIIIFIRCFCFHFDFVLSNNFCSKLVFRTNRCSTALSFTHSNYLCFVQIIHQKLHKHRNKTCYGFPQIYTNRNRIHVRKSQPQVANFQLALRCCDFPLLFRPFLGQSCKYMRAAINFIRCSVQYSEKKNVLMAAMSWN